MAPGAGALTRSRRRAIPDAAAARPLQRAERAVAEFRMRFEPPEILTTHTVRALLNGTVLVRAPIDLWWALADVPYLMASEAAPLLARFAVERDDDASRGCLYGHAVACRVIDNFGSHIVDWSSTMQCYHAADGSYMPLPRTLDDVVLSLRRRFVFAAGQIEHFGLV